MSLPLIIKMIEHASNAEVKLHKKVRSWTGLKWLRFKILNCSIQDFNPGHPLPSHKQPNGKLKDLFFDVHKFWLFFFWNSSYKMTTSQMFGLS